MRTPIEFQRELLRRMHAITVASRNNSLPELIDTFRSHPFHLSPWTTWCYLLLVQIRGRLRELHSCLEDRLGLPMLKVDDENLRPPHKGFLPGKVEWEYRYYGHACTFYHRQTGEYLQCDFIDCTADWIGQLHVDEYLVSLNGPQSLIVNRFTELFPRRDDWIYDFEILEGMGLIESNFDFFRLVGDWARIYEAMKELDAIQSSAIEEALLAALNDSRGTNAEALIPIRDDWRQSRLSQLMRYDPMTSDVALRLVSRLEPPDLPIILKKALASESNAVVAAALSIIKERHWEDKFQQEIGDLLDRDFQSSGREFSSVWIEAFFLLAKRNAIPIHRERILEIDSEQAATAAIHAMRWMPQYAVPLIRKALRSDDNHCLLKMSCALAIIDLEWSRKELVAALSESTDDKKTSYLRRALLESRYHAAHETILEWERTNLQAVGSQTAVHELEYFDSFKWMMDKIFDDIIPLRYSFIPPKPS